MDIQQVKQNRFQFLQYLYNTSHGDTSSNFDMWGVGDELGIDRFETERIVNYLIGESLIEHRMLGGGIGLTHFGIKEIEQALEAPDKPTEHFPPINIVNIGSMTNSNFQQGTTNSKINFQIDIEKSKEINEILIELNRIHETLSISIDLHKELVGEIKTLEIQVQSPQPKNIIITESLKTIRTILESVTGNALTPIIVEQISKLLN